MRHLVSVVAGLMCVMLVTSVFGQKKLRDMESRIKNIEGDLEVLQEFIQDQSKAMQQLKQRLEETGKYKAQIEGLDKKIGGVFDLTKQVSGDVVKVGQRVDEEARRIDAVEEALKKGIKFTGQLRVRPQLKTNFDTFNYELDDDQNLFATQRLRLGVDVAPAKGVEGRFILQDARGWGLNTQGPDPANPLRVHEGYMKLALDEKMATVKLGRQEWDFGAGRLIGNDDWAQEARSFDGLDLTLTHENFIKADFLFALLDERNATNGEDELFGGVYAVTPYLEDMTIEAYLLFLWDNRDRAKRNVSTLGLRSAGKAPFHKELFFDIELTLQFGTVTEMGPKGAETNLEEGDVATSLVEDRFVDNPHFAAAYHVELGYYIPVEFSLALSLFVDIASGDGNSSPKEESGNDQHVSFVPLFPTQHALLGKMDLWHLTNIIDFGGRLKVTPVENLLVGLEGHYLKLYAGGGPYPGGDTTNSSLTEPSPEDLGIEVDVDITYALSDHLALAAGYSVFLPGAAISDKETGRIKHKRTEIDPDDPENPQTWEYPGGDPAHWLFVQADLTF